MNEDEKNLTEIKNNDALVRKLTKMRKWLKAVEISFIFIFLSVILFFWVALYQGPIDQKFKLFIIDAALTIFKYTSCGIAGICLGIKSYDENFQYLEQSEQEKFKTYGYLSSVMLIAALLLSFLVG